MESNTIPPVEMGARLTYRGPGMTTSHAPEHQAPMLAMHATYVSGGREPHACNHRLFVELCRSADVLVVLSLMSGLFIATNAQRSVVELGDFLMVRLTYGNVALLVGFVLAWKHVFLAFGLYDVTRPRAFQEEVASVAAACAVGSALAMVFPLLSQSGAFGYDLVLLFWPAVTATTLAVRFGLRQTTARLHAGPAGRAIIVGSGPMALRLCDSALRDSGGRYQILGYVDIGPDPVLPEIRPHMLGTIADLEQILMHNVVDEVLIALPLRSFYKEAQRVIECCESAGVKSRFSADVFATRLARPSFDESNPHPTVAMNVVHDDQRLAIKRVVDVVGASVGLVALAPLMVAIAIAVKVTSPGPVLYRQERYGWRKRRFQMLKFRTMVADAELLQGSLEAHNEAVGPVFKIGEDPRVTRLGRFLRRKSLDELPQLWNVLRGDMSLVGPRPLPIRDVNLFAEPWLMRRFSVLPGCTGLWQISGRSNVGFDEWMRLDLQYIDQWSLALDLEILLRTVPAVLRGDGAR